MGVSLLGLFVFIGLSQRSFDHDGRNQVHQRNGENQLNSHKVQEELQPVLDERPVHPADAVPTEALEQNQGCIEQAPEVSVCGDVVGMIQWQIEIHTDQLHPQHCEDKDESDDHHERPKQCHHAVEQALHQHPQCLERHEQSHCPGQAGQAEHPHQHKLLQDFSTNLDLLQDDIHDGESHQEAVQLDPVTSKHGQPENEEAQR
mmetsp:Transcript_4876/g.11508  ORF Transcript_4876/g.11508 Transcript_4876/m.11508 type:complete len:203 (-) Transcript_4876:821-1429(-)